MKKRIYGGRYQRLFLTVLAAAFLMTGCAGSSGYANKSSMSADAAESGGSGYIEEGLYDETPEAADASDETGNAAVEADSTRKLIRELSMSVETTEFKQFVAKIEAGADSLGGYIEYSDSYSNESGFQNGTMSIRLPAEQMDTFIQLIEGASAVRSKNQSVRDVTLEYVDLETHLESLRAEMTSLLAMLEKAETLEDIITIQGRITEIRYEIESMESKRRTLANQVEYSTIRLNIAEVARVAAAVSQERSAWERISVGFSENMYKLGNGISNILINLAVYSPFLLFAVLIAGVLVLVIFGSVRFILKKEKQKDQKSKTEQPPRTSVKK